MQESNYSILVDENNQPYLAHHGVIGMCWGIRHDPKKTYARASKRFMKLASKSDKFYDKFVTYTKRATRRTIGSNKREAEIARRAYQKSKHYAKKASNYYQRMQKAFAKQKIVSLDPGLVSRGDNMIERYYYMRLKAKENE